MSAAANYSCPLEGRPERARSGHDREIRRLAVPTTQARTGRLNVRISGAIDPGADVQRSGDGATVPNISKNTRSLAAAARSWERHQHQRLSEGKNPSTARYKRKYKGG